MSGWKSFWDPSVPSRVLVFCGVAKKHKVLTIDKLRRRNQVIVNGCPMCLKDEETVHHLFIHCQFACKVWYFVLQCFDVNWVMPMNVEELFLQWCFGRKGVRGKILWKLVLYATIWKIWLERNRRVFRSISKPVEEIVQSIVWNVSPWACNRKEFGGISLIDLNRSWASVFEGHGHSKVVARVGWICPTPGILKLNFDGSFLRSTNQGGTGGVI
eukprot:TRINITY_DN15784_c0_g2_i1.p1 TRINITY_DN15784_c0_g2~~TRINITY_DN15784_c0_g2_i1.p1  ORF type:complete len:214 (-),score=16.90 TRINITY_DN15784_c0_g2_i1:200-841(-)